MGFAPARGTSGDELLAGAKKLLAHLRREYARCLAAWRQLPDPRWRPYHLFGPHDTPILLDPEADSQPPEANGQQPKPETAPPNSQSPASSIQQPEAPAAARCPFAFWDPLVQIAAALQISEYQLTRFCKLASGLTARQWWDLAKAQDPATGVRTRLRAELARDIGPRLANAPPYGVDLRDLREHVGVRRRARGQTTLSRALHWGYRNPTRMQEALFAFEGRTLAELEMAVLAELLEDWRGKALEAQRIRNEAAAREAVARMARHEAQREAERQAERQAAEREDGRRQGGAREDGRWQGGAREDGDAMVQDAPPARVEGSGAAESSSRGSPARSRDASAASRGSPAPRVKRDPREEHARREDRVQPPRHRASGYDF
jgi:hypothetical protein